MWWWDLERERAGRRASEVKGGRLGHQAVTVCSGRLGAQVMQRGGGEAGDGDVNWLRRWER